MTTNTVTIYIYIYIYIRGRNGMDQFVWCGALWGCLSVEAVWHRYREGLAFVPRGRLTYSLSLKGPFPQALTLLLGARCITCRFFMEMPTGPDAFLGMSDMSAIRPCTRIHHKKALCHTRPFGGARDNACIYKLVVVGCYLGLWHINLCRLFNAKSIFIQIIIFISNNSI